MTTRQAQATALTLAWILFLIWVFIILPLLTRGCVQTNHVAPDQPTFTSVPEPSSYASLLAWVLIGVVVGRLWGRRKQLYRNNVQTTEDDSKEGKL